MLYIRNINLVLETGILWDAALYTDGDVIAAFGKEAQLPVPVGAEVIDGGGLYVGPGFVDIHVHSGEGYSTDLEPVEAAAYFLDHGTTSLLATPCYDSPLEDFLHRIRTVKAAMGTSESMKAVKGYYMEGPYMNPQYGAGASQNPWKHPIDELEYKALVDEAGALVRVWAVAPEREGLEPFLKYARKVNPEVTFAVGHSEATPEEIVRLKKYGLTIQTHTMDATGQVPTYGGTRSCGPDEYCMMSPDMYAELISDSCGIHVSPALQRMVLHCKGVDKVILITDCTTHPYPNPENLRHVTDLNFDENGGISGSKLTMEVACRNVMTHTNCGIAQAFLMASRNPARAVGLDDQVGTIEIGKLADLVFVDDRFHVHKVILQGKIWKE